MPADMKRFKWFILFAGLGSAGAAIVVFALARPLLGVTVAAVTGGLIAFGLPLLLVLLYYPKLLGK